MSTAIQRDEVSQVMCKVFHSKTLQDFTVVTLYSLASFSTELVSPLVSASIQYAIPIGSNNTTCSAETEQFLLNYETTPLN